MEVTEAAGRAAEDRIRWAGWAASVALVLGGAIVFVAATGMRPSYDPFGWMVWGYQTLHGSLNTNGAPSWKPLTFSFTLPFAVFGHAQLWLWTVTSVAGSLAASVFAARIAYRLTGETRRLRAFAPYVAAGFAGLAVVGIQGWPHLILIANSDQLNTALLLAAIDAHLSGRPRLAFLAVIVAALGRPEVWPFAGVYGAWLSWRQPRMRIAVIASFVLVPAYWFVIPGVTAHDWLVSGDLALDQNTVIPGNKIVGVLRRWRHLYELPMQLAAVAGFCLGIARRDRRILTIAGLALAWVVIEIVFAYHGWSAASRYLTEPAAVAVTLVGALVGQLLGGAPWATRRPIASALRYAGPATVLVLCLALVPAVRSRVHDWRTDVPQARTDGRAVDRLGEAVKAIGGRAAVLSCGQPTTLVGSQSTVAWELGLNVGRVGYRIGKAIGAGEPIVAFKPHDGGWQVRVYNEPRSAAARCVHLNRDSAMG